jgi:hypothetical protein
MPKTYDAIATTTLGSDTAVVSFSNIPATYTDLLLTGHLSFSLNDSGLIGTIRNDTSASYSTTVLDAYTTLTSGFETNRTFFRMTGWSHGAGTTFNTPGFFTCHFFSYTNYESYRNIISVGTVKNNSDSMDTTIFANQYRSGSNLTSIQINQGGSASIKAGSVFTLYGIRAA